MYNEKFGGDPTTEEVIPQGARSHMHRHGGHGEDEYHTDEVDVKEDLQVGADLFFFALLGNHWYRLVRGRYPDNVYEFNENLASALVIGIPLAIAINAGEEDLADLVDYSLDFIDMFRINAVTMPDIYYEHIALRQIRNLEIGRIVYRASSLMDMIEILLKRYKLMLRDLIMTYSSHGYIAKKILEGNKNIKRERMINIMFPNSIQHHQYRRRQIIQILVSDIGRLSGYYKLSKLTRSFIRDPLRYKDSLFKKLYNKSLLKKYYVTQRPGELLLSEVKPLLWRLLLASYRESGE